MSSVVDRIDEYGREYDDYHHDHHNHHGGIEICNGRMEDHQAQAQAQAQQSNNNDYYTSYDNTYYAPKPDTAGSALTHDDDHHNYNTNQYEQHPIIYAESFKSSSAAAATAGAIDPDGTYTDYDEHSMTNGDDDDNDDNQSSSSSRRRHDSQRKESRRSSTRSSSSSSSSGKQRRRKSSKSKHHREESRRQRDIILDDDNNGRDNNERSTCLMIFSTVVLCLELAVGMMAIIYHDDLIECCGQSFFSSDDKAVERWNNAIWGIAIAYVVLIVIEIPVVALTEEPFFLFNPMIGFLLCVHMIYITNTDQSYIMFALQTVAMFGQSVILIQMERTTELCLHGIFNYTLCGLVVFILIDLSRMGGYCIVDGDLQTVFQESTCNMQCTDMSTCFVCDLDGGSGGADGVGGITDGTATTMRAMNSSCFIQFPTSSMFG